MDDLGQMLAHFTSMIIAPNYKKGRAPKAKNLWKTAGTERRREEQRAEKSKVANLDERRRERRERGQEFSKIGAPTVKTKGPAPSG